MWGYGGGVFLEGAHGKSAWQKCNTEDGGEDKGVGVGGAFIYMVSFPR